MVIRYGIRRMHAVRLVPDESGYLRDDLIQVRRYSCACEGCRAGNNCLSGNWTNVELVLREGPLPHIPVVGEFDDPDWDY